jgi:hypothetical protein
MCASLEDTLKSLLVKKAVEKHLQHYFFFLIISSRSSLQEHKNWKHVRIDQIEEIQVEQADSGISSTRCLRHQLSQLVEVWYTQKRWLID